MFQTAAGVTVPFPEKLSEQYELDGNTITANLSFEKLSDFVHSFYAELDEPLFLAIHPDAESDEVWYLDGMTKKAADHDFRRLRRAAVSGRSFGIRHWLSDHRGGAFRTEVQGSVHLQRDRKAFRSPAEKVRHGADRTSCHRMGYVLRRKARRRRAPRDRRSDRAGYDQRAVQDRHV